MYINHRVDALQVGEEHLHLLTLVSGYLISLGLAAFAGELACYLVGLPIADRRLWAFWEWSI